MRAGPPFPPIMLAIPARTDLPPPNAFRPSSRARTARRSIGWYGRHPGGQALLEHPIGDSYSHSRRNLCYRHKALVPRAAKGSERRPGKESPTVSLAHPGVADEFFSAHVDAVRGGKLARRYAARDRRTRASAIRSHDRRRLKGAASAAVPIGLPG
jgi:hypothetical protein